MELKEFCHRCSGIRPEVVSSQTSDQKGKILIPDMNADGLRVGTGGGETTHMVPSSLH